MNNWFLTAYEETQLLDGFDIACGTNAPVHQWLFWTTNPPWRHKVKGQRRGLLEAWSSYFCFDYFKMVEQNEPGDTLTHTFTLHDWPYCQTRWFVLKGEVSGVPSPSISPILELHNSYIIPPPFHWCASNHELLKVNGVDDWITILWTDNTPLKDHLPSNTKALVLHCETNDHSYSLGLRPKGSTWNEHSSVGALSQQWCVVGVNSNIEAEAWKHSPLQQHFYLEGYVLENGISLFTNPVEVTPPGDRTWETINLAALCPGAIGILAEILIDPANARSGIRMTGSTDNRDQKMRHNWTIIGCNKFQKIDFFTYDLWGTKGHIYIWGYVPAYASFYTNALDKTISSKFTWETIITAKPSNLAFFEITETSGWGDFKMRKKGATHDIHGTTPANHGFAIIPVDLIGRCEAFKWEDFISFHQVGEGH